MAAQSAPPGAVARNSTTLAQSSTIPSRRRAINLVRSRLLWLLPGMMILPEPWCFTIGPTRWTNTRSEQVHLHDKLQERRVKGAGLGVHGPTATAACIHDQDVDPTPSLDDPNNHQRYRLVVGHVDLDTQSGAVRCLNLDHSKRSNTVA